jgi:hypothetical protein
VGGMIVVMESMMVVVESGCDDGGWHGAKSQQARFNNASKTGAVERVKDIRALNRTERRANCDESKITRVTVLRR